MAPSASESSEPANSSRLSNSKPSEVSVSPWALPTLSTPGIFATVSSRGGPSSPDPAFLSANAKLETTKKKKMPIGWIIFSVIIVIGLVAYFAITGIRPKEEPEEKEPEK